MSVRLRSTSIVLAVAAALQSGCGTTGADNYVPPEALSPPMTQLADGLLKFEGDVKKESAQDYKRKVREDLVRIAVLTYLRGDLSPQSFKATMPEAVDLLCQPIYSNTRVMFPVENSLAKATAIVKLLQPPADGWKPLLKSLGSTYSIDVTLAEVSTTYDRWLQTDEGKACAAAVESANPHETRNYIGSEFAVAAGLAATKTAWDAIWGVVKPAVEDTLKNIDMERRNATLRAYFQDSNNVDMLKRDLTSTESFIDKEFRLAQIRTAGEAVVAQRRLLDFDSAHWNQIVADAKLCKTNLDELLKSKTHPGGVHCLDKAFATLSPVLDKALDTGDKFDESMAKYLPSPDKRLSAQVDTVAAIAQGHMPTEERAKALWAALVRYATLYNTTKETVSDENRKKIDDALKAFAEALQK